MMLPGRTAVIRMLSEGTCAGSHAEQHTQCFFACIANANLAQEEVDGKRVCAWTAGCMICGLYLTFAYAATYWANCVPKAASREGSDARNA